MLVVETIRKIRLTVSLTSLVSTEVDSKVVTIVRDIPMRVKRRGHEMRLVIDYSEPARVDQTLLKASARAYKWFNDLISGRVNNMNEIALQKGTNRSYVSRTINLTFLAPDITESIIAGRQPVDLTLEKLTRQIDLPLSWAQQRQLLISD